MILILLPLCSSYEREDVLMACVYLRITRAQTYVISPNINLRQAEKFVTLGTCLDNFFQRQIHPGIACDQVAVKCFAVFELDQHRVPLGGC